MELQEKYPERLKTFQCNVGEEEALEDLVEALKSEGFEPDLLLSTIGFLHTDSIQPEKSSRELSRDQLRQYFEVNTLSNMLILKHSKALLSRKNPSHIAVVNGKVASIEDNRLGGWYGYRMSKAALNMGLKAFSIELANSRYPSQVYSLHPGTVDTELSKPFRKTIRHEVFSPEKSVGFLLSALERKSAEPKPIHHITYDGEDLPW